MSGRCSSELGQQEFTRLVRYAYDRGIRFFETSESYGETQRMLGIALKGLPRESYRMMNKVSTFHGVDPHEKFEELRRNSDTDYFDIMLLHWQHTRNLAAGHGALAGRDSRPQSREDDRDATAHRCTDCPRCGRFLATSGWMWP